MCTSPHEVRRTGRPVVVGLVGGVASGKSTVARMFAEAGAVVVDADREAHAALDEPEVASGVRALWGERVFGPDGRVDRSALAKVVFDDPEALARLETLVHPRVEAAARRTIEDAARAGGASIVVIDAPLLVESGLDSVCDRILFVEAEEKKRRERVRCGRGWEPSELSKRERRQILLSDKRALADTTIDNRGSLENTRRQVAEAVRRLSLPEKCPPKPSNPRAGAV